MYFRLKNVFFLFCSCLMLTHKTMYVYICLMFLALNLGDIQIMTQGKILYNLLMECKKKLLDGVVCLPRVVLCQEEGRQQVFLKSVVVCRVDINNFHIMFFSLL